MTVTRERTTRPINFIYDTLIRKKKFDCHTLSNIYEISGGVNDVASTKEKVP